MVIKKKTNKKEPTWDEIGSAVGSKVEREHRRMKAEGHSCCCEKTWTWHREKPRPLRFVGAILFIVFLLVILNREQIIFHNISWWMETLLAIGFVWMMS